MLGGRSTVELSRAALACACLAAVAPRVGSAEVRAVFGRAWLSEAADAVASAGFTGQLVADEVAQELASWERSSHSGGGLAVVWAGPVGRVQPRAEGCSGVAPAAMVCAGQCQGAGRKGPIRLLVLAEEAAVGLLQPVCFCHPGLCNKALTKFKATMIYFFLQFCGLAACN